MDFLRADKFLHEKGFAASREKAATLIKKGLVKIHDLEITKTSQKIPVDYPAEAVYISPDRSTHFVGRAAEKLEYALEHFKISVEGKTAIDVGASTGGFTQVLLERGADKVFAVDVGIDQLHESLMNSPKVVNMEKTNFLDLTPDSFPQKIDLITVDVSFVSLKFFTDKLYTLSDCGSDILILIKPQFEAGIGQTKKGRVKEHMKRNNIINRVLGYFSDFKYMGGIDSPVPGKKSGNVEFLAHFRKKP